MSTGAGGHEIKNAFRRLAKIYHPDKNTTDTTEDFRIINDAYETLNNDEKRTEYDRSLINNNETSDMFLDIFEELAEKYNLNVSKTDIKRIVDSDEFKKPYLNQDYTYIKTFLLTNIAGYLLNVFAS